MRAGSSRKRIVITGGGGFIGANLARRLVELGYEVHIILRKPSDTWRLKEIKKDVALHNVDIHNKSALKKLMEKISPVAIYHFATYGSYRNQEDSEQIINTSINGTLNLLYATLHVNYKVFVNTGSSSEYGFKSKPMKETDILEPISFYAAAKASQTLLCQAFSYEYKKPIVTIRPFSVYGPYEQKDRFIPTIMRALIDGEPIRLTSGKQRRDFVFIDDLVDACISALRKPNKLTGKIINIGTGVEYTNDEIVSSLFKVTGRKTKVLKGGFPKRTWDSPHWVADRKTAKASLGWVPKNSLEKGLKKTYDWFLKNNHLYDD